MKFNPKKDEIAVTIPEFRMKKSADGAQRQNEIRIISLAIDEAGISNGSPSLHFNPLVIPKVRTWSWMKFGGQGRLIYGPKNPGKFLSYSILFVEDDDDLRLLGQTIEDLVKSDEAKAVLSVLTTTNPTLELASFAVSTLASLVSSFLKNNKNDEIACFQGTLLRDSLPPYNIGDTFTHGDGDNVHVTCPVKVLPLVDSFKEDMDLTLMGGIPQMLAFEPPVVSPGLN